MTQKNKNKIDTLKNSNGDLINDPIILENMVLNFYKQLFQEEDIVDCEEAFFKGFPEEHSLLLIKPFSNAEIKQALFYMFQVLGTKWHSCYFLLEYVGNCWGLSFQICFKLL